MLKQKEYLESLKARARTSRIYQRHQLLGLEIAGILGDSVHKTFYMKLAKEYDGGRLLQIAKTVAEKHDVKNRGAYFMKCLEDIRRPAKPKVPKEPKKKIEKKKQWTKKTTISG